MNKNLLRTCIGLVIGGSLLIGSAAMSIASGPTGYEALKAAIKNSNKIENATYQISGSLTDNNRELIKLSSEIKVQQEGLSSGKVFIDTDAFERNYIFSVEDNILILKHDASDVYNKITHTEKEYENKRNLSKNQNENVKTQAIVENIVDILVGDLKNLVTVADIENDKKQISIDLDKNEIPPLLNLLMNLSQNEDSNIEMEADNMISEVFGISLKDIDLPKLTDNIQPEKIKADFIVDKDNIINQINFELEVSGNDAQNNIHNRKLKLSFDISNINSTTADIIELDGKQVKEISAKELDCK
ncbi:MAG TPA: hypothetical protein PKY26_05830 [Acetivibrio clariflavus]|nr:hypothetical protein [Acetivibrio clariflavus]